MKQFKEYLKETSGKVVLTFGHFNPPNIENEKLINKVHESAEGGPYRIYTSQECDEHSPLEYNTKVKFMRKIFPRHARSIISDSKIVDLYDALDSLYEQGYTVEEIFSSVSNSTDINPTNIANAANAVNNAVNKRTNGAWFAPRDGVSPSLPWTRFGCAYFG